MDSTYRQARNFVSLSTIAEYVHITRRPNIAIALQSQPHGVLRIAETFLRGRNWCVTPKSAFLRFTRRHLPGFHLDIHEHVITRVGTHRFLGIILDGDMLEQKINRYIVSILCYIPGTSCGPSAESLLTVHRALVRLATAYSLPVWHGLSATLKNCLVYVFQRSLHVPRTTASAPNQKS